MKHKSRATRFSEAVGNISMLRERFDSMKGALDDFKLLIDENLVTDGIEERMEINDKLQAASKEAVNSITEHKESFDEVDTCVFEELRDELQNWLDNLPENLQSGSKADQLNDAISSLEEIIQFVEDLTSAGEDFNKAEGFELEAVESRIDALNTAIENCDNIEGVDVEFPGMFG